MSPTPIEDTPLGALIRQEIARTGPITLERYWNLALFHPEHGYYTVRDPFGRGGDFVTAPEISQMFGELIGAWLIAAWQNLGRPSPFILGEIGPGRGTLMADILRTVRRVGTDFLKAARVTLVETSPRLALLQAETLGAFDLPLRHIRRMEDMGEGPLILVANELFDAVAIRQFVASPDGWREKRVAVDAAGRLRFALAPAASGTPADLPAGLPAPRAGDTIEIAPQRLAIADAIAARIARHGGAALMIDYGHAGSGYGDTLQALKDHAFADPLGDPGLADITSHVDFGALAERFAARGLSVAPVAEQGAFLRSLGLEARAASLARGLGEGGQEAIVAAAQRLCGRGRSEMGSLFKVLAVASQALPLPPFAAQ